MLGEIQQTNMKRVFDTLDVSLDGNISADDFQILAQRMRALRPDIDPQLMAEIEEAFTAWWETFQEAADTDGDGKISREEFIAAVDKGLESDPNYVDRMMRVSEVTFRAADVDGDGTLTPLEVTRLYRAYGVNDQHSNETFARIDGDGDGRISIEEFLQAARDVYLSNDPAAPGAVMFGPVA